MARTSGRGDRLADTYVIDRVLGRGGFGTTYAARDARGREVAIKQLDLRHVDDWKSVELFEREAEVLQRLDHPQIPNYIDFLPIEADRAGLLIQELAPGRSLDKVLEEEGRLEEAQVIAIAQQVLGVLAYLGDLRPAVVHRDIKPANLMLDGDGGVCLVDFGAVKDAAGRASTIGSTVAGTFGYMAPEIIRGSGEPRSDLYALGITMITLLTGLAPTDLPSRRLKPLFRDHARCSAGVLDVIDRLIEPVPDDRYADASSAQEALADAVAAAALDDPGADLGALVAVRARERRRAKEHKEALARRERDATVAKLAKRERRVSVAGDERIRVTIAPLSMRALLRDQLFFGVAFASLNPGIVVISGLSMLFIYQLEIEVLRAIALAILTWTVVLLGLNLMIARLRQRPRMLDFTADGHFALHSGDPRRAELIGRADELTARIDTPDPASLGSLELSCNGTVEIESLSAADLTTLHEVLAERCEVH